MSRRLLPDLFSSLRAPARGLFLCLALVATDKAAAEDLASGQARALSECGPCHQIGASASGGAGPSLNGIVGRPAGSLPDYPYSEAMRAAGRKGLIWYPDDIKDYLVPGQTLVPDTAMAFGGVPGQFERDDLAAFLATLKADAGQ